MKKGAVMFHAFFGFRLCMGRLAYFLSTSGLAAVSLVLVGGILSLASTFGSESARGPIAIGVGVVFVPLFIWAQCNITGMRVRDIGWNPAVIVPLWVLLTWIDYMLSFLVPELALPNALVGTVIGKILSMLFLLTLLFKAGKPGGYVDPPADSGKTAEARAARYLPNSAGVVPPSRFDRQERRTSFGRLPR